MINLLSGINPAMLASIATNQSLSTPAKLGTAAISAIPYVGNIAASLIMGNEERKEAERLQKEQELNKKKQEAYTKTMIDLNNAQATKPTFVMGGKLDIIVGNKHSKGGVDIGVAEVEGGETVKDRFVFSNKIVVNDEIAKMHPYFEKLKGKSIADVSKKIDKEFSLRKADSFDMRTKETLLGYLKLSQEVDKINSKVNNTNKAIKKEISKIKMEEGGWLYGSAPEGLDPKTFYELLDEYGIELEGGKDYKWGKGHEKAYKALEDKQLSLRNEQSSLGTNLIEGERSKFSSQASFNEDFKGNLLLNNNNIALSTVAMPEGRFDVGKTDWVNILKTNKVKGINDSSQNITENLKTINTDIESQNGIGNLWDKIKDKWKEGEGLDKKFNWNTLALVGNMGNLYDIGRGIHGLLKPEKKFDRAQAMQTQATFLDPTRAIQDVNTGYNIAANSLGGVSSGIGSYLSNRLGLASSRAKAISSLESNYQAQNAQIGNQTNMFNAQQREKAMLANLEQQKYQELINQQERDIASNMIQGGLSNMSETLLGLKKDRRATDINTMLVKGLESGNYKFDEDGNFTIIRE